MAHAFIEEFKNRKRHVRHYLMVVGEAERGATLGASAPTQGRLLTVRAGTFLVLYNLVEATARSCIQAIHDEVSNKKAEFPRLNESLRRRAVKLFRSSSSDSGFNMDLLNFPASFAATALEEAISFGGNIDARKVRELADIYGFSSAVDAVRTRSGRDLITVKKNRNDLAHGDATFEDVGRQYTYKDLLRLSVHSVRYMEGMVNNVASYIDGKQYLDDPEFDDTQLALLLTT
jgi:hypothetical protein